VEKAYSLVVQVASTGAFDELKAGGSFRALFEFASLFPSQHDYDK